MGTAPGLITVAGDAAHPMTPNLGQGGCVAAEVSYRSIAYCSHACPLRLSWPVLCGLQLRCLESQSDRQKL